MKKCFVFILLGLALHFVSFSQDKDETKSGLSFNASLTNLGGGLGVHYSMGKDIRHYLISIDAYSIKNPYETSSNPTYGNELGRKFVYRKLNYFGVLSPSFGIQKNIIPRSNTNLINLRVGIKMGPAIGLLSPYQLELYNPGSADNRSIEVYDPANHTYSQILGRARFFASDLTINTRIGFSLKTFALLDFARNQRYINGLSLGLNADIFANPVPIMAELDKLQNQRIFVAGLIGLMIGNRW